MISLLLSLALYQNIIITEVQIKESHIKLFNPNPYEIDLSGYKLRKKSSTGKEYSIRVFPKETVIKANDYLIWATSKDDYHLKIGAQLFSSATLSRDNSVALTTKDGEIIDMVAWGKGEDQFVLGSPAYFDSSKNNGIKRVKDGDNYLNQRDNSLDFKNESKIEIPSSSLKTKKLVKEEKSQACLIGAGLAIISSLLIVSLNRSYGRS